MTDPEFRTAVLSSLAHISTQVDRLVERGRAKCLKLYVDTGGERPEARHCTRTMGHDRDCGQHREGET